MNNCSHDIKRKLHANDAFLKGAIMRILVMAMLLLSFVGCGSVVENNPGYPALKLLKTERDSVTGQVRVTVVLTRTPYTKKFYFYSKNGNIPSFIFKNTLSFRLNNNLSYSSQTSDSKYYQRPNWFKPNRNIKPTQIDGEGYDYDYHWHLLQDLSEQKEFSILLPDSEWNQRIGITFYPMINNSGIQLDNPITIWTDDIPRIQ